jgi:hypothetical protein
MMLRMDVAASIRSLTVAVPWLNRTAMRKHADRRDSCRQENR